MPSKSIYNNIPLSYVYKITNKTTKQFYIGFRCANIKLNLSAKDDLLKVYFTSGILENDLRSNHVNYNSEILFESSETIILNDTSHFISFWYEQILIKEQRKNPLLLNRKYFDPDTMSGMFITNKAPKSAFTKDSIPWNVGIPMRESTKKLQSKTQSERERPSIEYDSRREKIQCPYCNKIGAKGPMHQWHFNNCKLK